MIYPPISILTLHFWTPHFLLLDSTLFRLDSTFWLDSTLKLNSEDPCFDLCCRGIQEPFSNNKWRPLSLRPPSCSYQPLLAVHQWSWISLLALLCHRALMLYRMCRDKR